jgi:hypothetical protein
MTFARYFNDSEEKMFRLNILRNDVEGRLQEIRRRNAFELKILVDQIISSDWMCYWESNSRKCLESYWKTFSSFYTYFKRDERSWKKNAIWINYTWLDSMSRRFFSQLNWYDMRTRKKIRKKWKILSFRFHVF